MTENQSLNVLKAIGAKEVTTNRQKKNGTTAFKLPTGEVVTEHKTGYIRRILIKPRYTCYQLNPVYKTKWKAISSSGKLVESEMNSRMLIYSRPERLKRLALYAVKKKNK